MHWRPVSISIPLVLMTNTQGQLNIIMNGRQGLQEEICQAVLLKVKVKFATFSFRVNLLGDPTQWTLNPDKRWRKAKHSMADYQNFFPRKLADISRVDTSDCCFKWNGEQLTKEALALFDIQWITVGESITEKKSRSYGHFPYGGRGLNPIPYHTFWGAFPNITEAIFGR